MKLNPPKAMKPPHSTGFYHRKAGPGPGKQGPRLPINLLGAPWDPLSPQLPTVVLISVRQPVQSPGPPGQAGDAAHLNQHPDPVHGTGQEALISTASTPAAASTVPTHSAPIPANVSALTAIFGNMQGLCSKNGAKITCNR
jgi:hypothetical protein